VARPRTPAAARMAAPAAANCSGGVDDTRASRGAARAEGCGAALSWDRGRAQQLQRQGAPPGHGGHGKHGRAQREQAPEGK